MTLDSFKPRADKNALGVFDWLEQQQKFQPRSTFLKFFDRSYSFEELANAYGEKAGILHQHNVRPGDIVPTLLGNSGECVEVWFAIMHLGGVWAALNTEFRGEQLARAINVTRSPILILEERFIDLLSQIIADLPHLNTILVIGDRRSVPGFAGRVVGLDDEAERAPPRAELKRDQIAVIHFTSGSTGLSKPVMLSHGYLISQAQIVSREFGFNRKDVLYCPFPLYHWDCAIATVMAALVTGCAAAIAPRFSVSKFWDDIAFFEATVFDFMGATLSFLYNQEERPDDKNNSVRLAWGAPMPKFRDAFEQRFGLRLFEAYGSTEGGVSVYQRPDEHYPEGSCGRPAPEFQLRIVDASDRELARGEIGEIIVMPSTDPTGIMSGYYEMPEANAQMIRDGWYHTGDLGYLDVENNLFFAGRKKDVIRRRGENISAIEIEQVVESMSAVVEAAAFGVPSPHTEEDVAVALIVRPGETITRAEISRFCESKMAKYMRPDHIFVLKELPKTPTGKVAKAELKKQFSDPESLRASL